MDQLFSIYPPTAMDGGIPQQWPDYCMELTNPTQASSNLSRLDWQTIDWHSPENLLKYADSDLASPGETIESAGSTSFTMATTTGYNHSQTSESEYCASMLPSPISDHNPHGSPTTLLETAAKKKPGRPRGNSKKGEVKPKPPHRKTKVKDEKASRERIREKNRIAADKCRGRQRVATDHLSSKHDALEQENLQLTRILDDLIAERIVLKNMLIEHGNCGSEMIETYLKESAARWIKEIEAQAIKVEAA